MSVTISGTTGVSKVQDGVIVPADFDSSVSLGKVLQVVNTTSTVTSGTQINTATPYTVCTLNITPEQANSKFLIIGTWSQNITCNDNFQNAMLYMFRDSTEIRRYFFDYYGQGTGTNENSDQYNPQTHSYYYTVNYTLGDTLTFHSKISAARGSGSVAYPTVEIRNQTGSPAPTLTIMEIG